MKLKDYGRVIVSANVRGQLDFSAIEVEQRRGFEGDFVLVNLEPSCVVNLTDNEGILHAVSEPTLVIAVLGSRESSTHVVGVIPPEGCIIEKDVVLGWIGGNSGIVGIVENSPRPNNSSGAEFATRVSCIGVLVNGAGASIGVGSCSIESSIDRLTIPIIAIAATSAEAGKTTLACQIIREYSILGVSVSAIKATGTGGVLDSISHQTAGASLVFDQVDAGLITTYNNPKAFARKIKSVFLKSEELGAKVIVCEMGGDFVWAGNLTLLSLEWFRRCLAGMLIICNDALSAVGAVSIMGSHPFIRYELVASPFRNFTGMQRRTRLLLDKEVIDPNDSKGICLACRNMVDSFKRP